MATEADDLTSTNTYELTCNDCTFEMTVEGSVYEALTVVEEHREKHEKTYAEHFVDFHLRE